LVPFAAFILPKDGYLAESGYFAKVRRNSFPFFTP